ncbi:NAD(P)-binding protein [Linderina pennispora]|uniref:NAD(P)-binding protein n=1 Tax=Linderina pennispora TaxID=61395 RepID=A0A1Y1W6G4_9FUNG|nr:NAD(P)-binding protein [Linderina pennispora]ORX69133.1 NAD(P)-binding protein [Linderina pennispora]
MSARDLRVGLIGLGNMGLAMAINLQKHRAANGLSPISINNRTISKCAQVEELGAVARDTPGSVAANSDVVFLSLVNDAAVKDIVTQLLDSLKDDSSTERLLIADTTTVHPSTTQWVLEEISRRQSEYTRPVSFAQTPVWGAPPAAKAAMLVFVTSGEAEGVLGEIAVPAFARVAISCGTDQIKAARYKILGNFMIASVIESLGEAMAVAEEAGIGRELYFEFIKEVFPVPPVMGYALKMVADNGEASKTQVGFNVPGGMKDVGYAIDVAREAGMRLPIAELAYEHLQWVKDNGGEKWDWSSLAYALRKEHQK